MLFHFLQDGNIMSDCVSLYELPRMLAELHLPRFSDDGMVFH